MKISMHLDISIGDGRFQFRGIAPFKLLAKIIRKTMNLLKKWNIPPTCMVEETQHFKRNNVLYITKKISDKDTEIWGVTLGEKEPLPRQCFGKIVGGKGGTWEKPKGYYSLYRGDQRHAELVAKIVIEGLEKPYRLADQLSTLYR